MLAYINILHFMLAYMNTNSMAAYMNTCYVSLYEYMLC